MITGTAIGIIRKSVSILHHLIRRDLIRETTAKLLQTARIASPPVDLDKIAGLYTSSVVYHEAPEFSYTVKYKGLYFVCLHKSSSACRDRWSFAHELGHIALNHFTCLEDKVMFSLDSMKRDECEFTMQSDSTRLSDEQRLILEHEADLFAEELLLPRSLFRPIISLEPSLPIISSIFQVSCEAINILLQKIKHGNNRNR